jgi:hypothetical protein
MGVHQEIPAIKQLKKMSRMPRLRFAIDNSPNKTN